MLVIVHQHQSNRAQAISTIQQAYAASHSTPTTSRKRSTDYNMFCSPTDKPFTAAIPNVDDNEDEYGGPAASDMAVQRRSAIRDELFDDSDEDEGQAKSDLVVQHISNIRDELFDDSD